MKHALVLAPSSCARPPTADGDFNVNVNANANANVNVILHYIDRYMLVEKIVDVD